MLDRQLLVISGKGGVGKSAIAASIALRAVRTGRRVLAIGLTPESGLAGHFGVDHLEYRPLPVRPGIDALVVERTRALDEYLKLQLHVPQGLPTGQLAKALNVLIDTAPGVREIVSIGKPIYEVWRGDHDLVIVDAPSLGQLMSYLRAPTTIATLVPAGIVQDQASRMAATLADPAVSGLVLVATPEELPVTETTQALDDLAEAPVIDLVEVVANRVLSPLEVKPQIVGRLPAGAHRDAAELHISLHATQRRWLERLPDGPRLPYLFGMMTPGEVAARLADEWDLTSEAA